MDKKASSLKIIDKNPDTKPANYFESPLPHTITSCKSRRFDFINYPGANTVPKNYKNIRIVKVKRWYIEYFYRVPAELVPYIKKQWDRFRVFDQINKEKTDQAAQHMLAIVTAALQDGFTPFSQHLQKLKEIRAGVIPEKIWTIQQALYFFLQKWKQRGIEVQSVQRYERTTTRFLNYVFLLGIQNYPIQVISESHVENFLITVKSWSNRQYNNELNFLSTIFNYLVKKGILLKNPCAGITRRKTVVHKHRFYDHKLLVLIKKIMATEDPYLNFAAQIVYYLCVRSEKELKALKVGSIFPERKLVLLEAKETKTGTGRYIPIPDELMKIFKKRKVFDYPKDYYLFSAPHKTKFIKDGNPGPRPFGSGFFSKRFRRIRKKLKLSTDYTIYGFKHTRVVHMKLDGATDAEIMSVTGHKDFTAYAKYLRDLGVDVNVAAVQNKTRVF